MPFMVILSNIAQLDRAQSIFEFWFLFPIAGVALLFINRITYIIFFMVQVYSAYFILNYIPYTWPFVAATPHLYTLCMLAFNIFIMIYLLLPSIRVAFFSRDARWWQNATRYTSSMPCRITFGNVQDVANWRIVNISRSGAFIEGPKDIRNFGTITLDFDFFEKDLQLSLQSKVVDKHIIDGVEGYGVQFQFDSIWDQIKVHTLTSYLRRETLIRHG